jgi:zinc transporter ZupT
MLPDATKDFFHAGYHYPTPFLIAGCVFLFLLLLEHISASLDSTLKFPSRLALLTTLMLSIHSFLEGSALGISPDLATTLIIFIAIIAHKSAASFALATQLNKSNLKLKAQILAFTLFALMTPIGIFLGTGISTHSLSHPYHSGCLLLTPIFSSMAAGTFLYIGTLHGLERANLIRNCGQIREFFYMLLGFCLMAVIAIWA